MMRRMAVARTQPRRVNASPSTSTSTPSTKTTIMLAPSGDRKPSGAPATHSSPSTSKMELASLVCRRISCHLTVSSSAFGSGAVSRNQPSRERRILMLSVVACHCIVTTPLHDEPFHAATCPAGPHSSFLANHHCWRVGESHRRQHTTPGWRRAIRHHARAAVTMVSLRETLYPLLFSHAPPSSVAPRYTPRPPPRTGVPH